MSKIFRVFVVAVSVCLFGLPAFSQQTKGDSELGLNASFTVPLSDPGTSSGLAQISYGYYFKSHDLFGVDTLVFITNGDENVFFQGRYRHLFGTGNPKVFPFVGAAGGVNVDRLSGSTTNDGIGTGEAGVKFFVSQRTAFEVAYNFQYIHMTGQSFKQNSQSVITFGFTHLFGGHR